MGHSPAEVRSFEAGDRDEVLDVLNAAFGRWPGTLKGTSSVEHFEWKHRGCPFGRSLGTVAVVDAKVAGFTAWIPWLVRNGGDIVTTMRGVDLAVDPAYHGRGIGAALIDRATESVPAETPFSWQTPNDRSRSNILRAGVGALEPVRRYARPVPRQTIRRLAARVIAARAPGVEARTAAEVLSDGVDEAVLRPFASGPKARLATVKSLDYLCWRYGQLPGYHAIRAEGTSDGPLVIFRVADRGRLRVAYISELLVEPGDARTARRLLDRVAAAAPVDFVSCRFDSPRQAARCGFVELPGGPIPTVTTLRKGFAPDPRRSASWELSLGDLELL